jgi:glutamate/tyrosine decarboxylase-like PLP-dependent enzyme
MNLVPFSTSYPHEFLSRTEDNFPLLLEKLKLFYDHTRDDIGDGSVSRRKLKGRFNYEEELKGLSINQKGVSTEEAAAEFNEMIQGCMRHNDPTTAFNLNPSPLFDIVAGMTLFSLYTPNSCWDFASGKLCLFEKKIVRMLGQLVDWPEADGLVITGGKQALIYAIKNGMGRVSAQAPVEMRDFVVLSSDVAHYSIEHVCHYLGISPENCLRVPSHPSGEMDLEALEHILNRVISENKKIAAVIAVAGATINLVPDPIASIKKVLDATAENRRLNYTPYLHVDSVISWVYLAFAKEPNTTQYPPRISEKIEHVLSQLRGIHAADSFAADFHKTGFCPYSSGVFIAKETANLSGMAPDRRTLPKNMLFGEAEIYRLTLENSRSGLPIVAIWIALRRLGLEGLRQFILYQLTVCERFKEKLRTTYSEHFEVLNEHSNGWEIVIKPHFGGHLSWDQLQTAPSEHAQLYQKACHLFLSHVWYGSLHESEHQTPVFGFIKSYSRKGSHERKFPAFLIHPSSLHYNEQTIDEMLERIVETKISFETHYLSSLSACDLDQLYQCTPPR